MTFDYFEEKNYDGCHENIQFFAIIFLFSDETSNLKMG